MSIASELNRISSAKSDIITAIRSKGVEVPDTVKIEELADYIALIVQGTQITVTDDDSGNLVIDGLTAVDDDEGNVTIAGTTASATDDNGNVKIGE